MNDLRQLASRPVLMGLAFLIPLLTTLTIYTGWQAERDACAITTQLIEAGGGSPRECGELGGDEIFPVVLALIVGAGVGVVAATRPPGDSSASAHQGPNGTTPPPRE